MSHAWRIGSTRFVGNGDLSGNVRIVPDDPENQKFAEYLEIPFADMIGYFASLFHLQLREAVDNICPEDLVDVMLRRRFDATVGDEVVVNSEPPPPYFNDAHMDFLRKLASRPGGSSWLAMDYGERVMVTRFCRENYLFFELPPQTTGNDAVFVNELVLVKLTPDGRKAIGGGAPPPYKIAISAHHEAIIRAISSQSVGDRGVAWDSLSLADQSQIAALKRNGYVRLLLDDADRPDTIYDVIRVAVTDKGMAAIA